MHYAVMVAAGIAPNSIDAATTADLALGIVDEIASRVVGLDESDELTPRQREIAIMYARGVQVGEIATALSLSKTTVSSHLYAIYSKLNVHTRSSLTVYGFDHGWLDERQEGEAA